MKKLMTICLVLVLVLARSSLAMLTIAGDDTFSSIGKITIEIFDPFYSGGFTETIVLNDGGIPGIVHRDAQIGTTIDTEIVSLNLSGTSSFLGPVNVRVGTGNGVLEGASLGSLTNVEQDPLDPGYPTGDPSAVIQADSFFDVFFEIDIPSLSMTAYNKQPHMMGPETIYSLPPIGTTYVSPGTVPLFLDRGTIGDHTDDIVIGSVGPLSHTVIPAPGAILLGSIGVGLIGWLRRRRTF